MKFTPTFAVLLVSITASVLAAPYPNVPRSGQGNLAAYGGQGKGSSPATKGKPSGGGRKQYQKPAPRYDDDDNSDDDDDDDDDDDMPQHPAGNRQGKGDQMKGAMQKSGQFKQKPGGSGPANGGKKSIGGQGGGMGKFKQGGGKGKSGRPAPQQVNDAEEDEDSDDDDDDE